MTREMLRQMARDVAEKMVAQYPEKKREDIEAMLLKLHFRRSQLF